jgi:general secretion pathway protein G
MRKQRGFTLIELLVVIAIIGLLSTLAVVALNNARQKSRDARRISDVKQIQTALELYFNDANSYPAGVTAGSAISFGGVTYMNAAPANPTPNNDGSCPASTDYAYTQTSSGASYTISYCIGSASGSLTAGTHTATPAGIQ